MLWSILWDVWVTCPGHVPSWLPVHLLTGRAWHTEKYLIKCKHCSATTKISMCYQHYSYTEFKTQHCTSCWGNEFYTRWNRDLGDCDPCCTVICGFNAHKMRMLPCIKIICTLLCINASSSPSLVFLQCPQPPWCSAAPMYCNVPLSALRDFTLCAGFCLLSWGFIY